MCCVYIGKVQRDNAHDIRSFLYLPWPPWVVQHRQDHFYLCCTAQCGQGKYSSDCHVSLSLTVLLTNFANVNDLLLPQTSKEYRLLKSPCLLYQYCQWLQQQKKKIKEEAYPWKAGTSSGHITNLKQSILETFDIYDYYCFYSVSVTAENKYTLVEPSIKQFLICSKVHVLSGQLCHEN